jgi:signal transduction histidine kinase/FixJ family two-component response regulator
MSYNTALHITVTPDHTNRSLITVRDRESSDSLPTPHHGLLSPFQNSETLTLETGLIAPVDYAKKLVAKLKTCKPSETPKIIEGLIAISTEVPSFLTRFLGESLKAWEALNAVPAESPEKEIEKQEKIRQFLRIRFLCHEIKNGLPSPTILERVSSSDEIEASYQDIALMAAEVADKNRYSPVQGVLSPTVQKARKELRSVHQLLESVCGLLKSRAEEKGVRIERTFVGTEPGFPTQPFSVDFQGLKHILMNLVGNAIQYCDPSHPVELMVTQVKQRADSVELLFEVTNQGKPIPPEKLRKLFQPFSGQDERNALSTGLGLSCSQMMVQEMGGEILCTSSQITGETSFYFALTFDLLEPGLLAYKQLNVLSVDDDSSIRRTTSVFFKTAAGKRDGFELSKLYLAPDGYEAISYFTNSVFTNKSLPDVILLDLFMDGLSGLETAKAIHALAKEEGIICPPIIMATGDQLSAKELAAIPAELQLTWVQKPYSKEVFIRAVNRRVGEQRALEEKP